ncbi:hypothetical protein Plec18167_003867 [Paecilomyces lecythidis]|uniref:Fatty acid hydroxylase domain-containing protein n=1 Tax=Paecilomyces lecythidis TaxID=3004212 RepID=A0ABR3XWS9_9EURO
MEAPRNPKDSMKMTWPKGPRDKWGIHHWAIELLNAYPLDLNKEVPVHSKQDKVPHMPGWSAHRWILVYASIPLILHQAYTYFTGRYLGPIAAFWLYFGLFNAVVIKQVYISRRLGHQYGFLDGDKHERDGIPDVGVGRVVQSLYKTTGGRIALAIWLTYKPDQLPLDMRWEWLFLEIGLYGIVLDFWFYWYHRAMHDIDWLWRYHRTHHLTKHPNVLLTAYADHEQEFFDMVGVPFMTYATLKLVGLPMTYYEWWICHQYIVFTEVFGHSGIRMNGSATSTLSWLLDYFGWNIIIEDHDLHHRKGYRKSYNYGKQTRVWDKLFGTCHDRIETYDENIDYENTVTMPLF